MMLRSLQAISRAFFMINLPSRVITRDQRAHRRLSWTQRWEKNLITDISAHWRVSLFGISSAILDWLGTLKPSPVLII
jgi:hypothetical protein